MTLHMKTIGSTVLLWNTRHLTYIYLSGYDRILSWRFYRNWSETLGISALNFKWIAKWGVVCYDVINSLGNEYKLKVVVNEKINVRWPLYISEVIFVYDISWIQNIKWWIIVSPLCLMKTCIEKNCLRDRAQSAPYTSSRPHSGIPTTIICSV